MLPGGSFNAARTSGTRDASRENLQKPGLYTIFMIHLHPGRKGKPFLLEMQNLFPQDTDLPLLELFSQSLLHLTRREYPTEFPERNSVGPRSGDLSTRSLPPCSKILSGGEYRDLSCRFFREARSSFRADFRDDKTIFDNLCPDL